MAGTCKSLQIAVATKSGHQFGENLTILYTKSFCEDNEKKGVQFSRFESVRVIGPTILPFFRCFGAHISKLDVHGSNNFVIRYINRYCADTLTIIRFQDIHKEMFAVENFPKQFKMIE